MVGQILNWVGDNLPWTPIGRAVNQQRENAQMMQYRNTLMQHQQKQWDAEEQQLKQQSAARDAAKNAWESFPDQALITPPVTGPQQFEQNKQAVAQHNWGLMNSVPQQQRPFWEGMAQADPLGALKLYGEQTTLAANQPSQQRLETFGPANDPYGQGGFGQRNTVTGQISGYNKASAPEKPEGPLTEIGKLVADRNAGRITPEDFNLGIRGLQAEIAQRERGPSDRGPSGLINLQMSDGRIRAFRQDDPELDRALSSGAYQVNAGTPGAGPLQPQQWRGIPFAQPQRGGSAPTTYLPKDADYTEAVGLWGTFQNAANNALDTIGATPRFENNLRATEALSTLELQTRTMLQDALPGRPSNYLLQEFNRLVAKPNQLWGGGKARTGERLQQTRDFLSNVEAQLQEVLSNPGGYTRAQVGVARTKATQVREMRGAYEQILRRGGMSGNASGTTNGVGWRIVE